MLPPELVELIIYCAWSCLSTSSHRHGHSMTQWMLVSRDWLKIVLSVVFRDLWITSYAHIDYITDICCYNTSFVCELVGITNVHLHLAETCRSLTISVYTTFEDQYASQCRELIEYATTDSSRERLLSKISRYEYAIPCQSIVSVVHNYTPDITSLHFVLVDCPATFSGWDTLPMPYITTREYPLSLTELHVTFAYTSPPSVLLLDAPRGTFFPPPSPRDLPPQCRFDGVRRLVVRDANADFVAFLTTACPQLETVESTAAFGAEDVPADVPADVKARLVFIRLPRTEIWGLIGGDAKRRWGRPPVRKRRNSIWGLLKRIFEERT
ncbi:hypothetical protein B0H14DRAFT_2779487 [Mycena olivaceomarginata]|nr:hypothetical protein B0H14DRAFT_2779487 [Mycena olivaceomarginata]